MDVMSRVSQTRKAETPRDWKMSVCDVGSGTLRQVGSKGMIELNEEN